VALEALVDHNLVLQRVAGRYQLHDLVRIYARTLADTETTQDRGSALDRLANALAVTANRLACVAASVLVNGVGSSR